MTNRLFIKTFGCQMNEYDSAKMADVLKEAFGTIKAEHPQDADILLLNTCSVRDKAQEKVFSLLGRWRAYKAENPSMIIGVGGCVASQEGEAIFRRAPYVDLVFGPQTLHRLPEMITGIRSGQSRIVDISFPEIEKFDHLPAPQFSSVTAFVSVMEGCSKYCTFCVVPYTRGEETSRPLDGILAEIRGLGDLGVSEITLLGQNVNAYRGPTDTGQISDLAALIRQVADIEA
ncbi:MAG: radical SAM protein, partial [Gammaproteobacteria bacterium]